MTEQLTLDATLTPQPQRESHAHALAIGSFFVAVAIVAAVTAVVSDYSLSPDQRIEVFRQSGMYP